MSTPATRSLPAVLRRLTAPGDDVRVIVGSFTGATPSSPRYAVVSLAGQSIEVPKAPAEAAGQAAYLLAWPGRLLVLGGGGGAQGPQGEPGPQGPSGASTFVSGTGPPAAAVGVDGSVYLDTQSGRVWGPKAAGAWPAAAMGRLVPLNPTYAQLTTG